MCIRDRNRIDLEQVIKKRSEAFAFYENNLDPDTFKKISTETQFKHAYFGYPVLVENPEQVILKLSAVGVKIGPLSNKWCFLDDDQKPKFPNVCYFLNHHLIFPTSEHITKSDLTLIVETSNSI